VFESNRIPILHILKSICKNLKISLDLKRAIQYSKNLLRSGSYGRFDVSAPQMEFLSTAFDRWAKDAKTEEEWFVLNWFPGLSEISRINRFESTNLRFFGREVNRGSV